jgi:hypothetical protein
MTHFGPAVNFFCALHNNGALRHAAARRTGFGVGGSRAVYPAATNHSHSKFTWQALCLT